MSTGSTYSSQHLPFVLSSKIRQTNLPIVITTRFYHFDEKLSIRDSLILASDIPEGSALTKD